MAGKFPIAAGMLAAAPLHALPWRTVLATTKRDLKVIPSKHGWEVPYKWWFMEIYFTFKYGGLICEG